MPDNSEVILREILNNASESADAARVAKSSSPAPFGMDQPEGEGDKKKETEDHAQWAIGGNGRFMPVGATTGKLGAGVYETFAVPGLWGLERMNIASDGLYTLPDMATQTVLDEVKKFWASEANYRKHNLLYRRGIIMFGPPGSGKTAAVKLLMNELVNRDGIVLIVSGVQIANLCLKAIRRIEPRRNLIVVFEDIEEILNYQGEAAVLSMLDGENNVDNVLNIASTNYPEKLGARIINRPSRFDRRIFVGMPSVEARTAYFQKVYPEVEASTLSKWVEDTDKMSIAHLKELVVAVNCLEQPYDEVIERLKEMSTPPKSEDGLRKKKMGFDFDLE